MGWVVLVTYLVVGAFTLRHFIRVIHEYNLREYKEITSKDAVGGDAIAFGAMIAIFWPFTLPCYGFYLLVRGTKFFTPPSVQEEKEKKDLKRRTERAEEELRENRRIAREAGLPYVENGKIVYPKPPFKTDLR